MTVDEEELCASLRNNQWDYQMPVGVLLMGIDVLVLHGLVTLALRHPQLPHRVVYRGTAIDATLERILLDIGAITAQQLERLHALEADRRARQ